MRPLDPTWYEARRPAPPPRQHLTGRHEALIGIIGGGLAGLATALSLAERGHRPVLLEAGRVGAGASGRNGGLAAAGFARHPRSLVAALGETAAARLMAASRAGLDLLRARIARYRIACDLEAGVLTASWRDDPQGLAHEQRFLNERCGMRLAFWPRERLAALYPSPRYHDGLFDPDGCHLDPLALCRGYAAAAEGQGVVVLENSPATACLRAGAGWRVGTREGELLVRHLVLAQSTYPPPLLASLTRAVLPVLTSIIVTAPLEGPHAHVIKGRAAVHDDRFATGYYRLLPDGRLLWGGRISTVERRHRLVPLMRRDLAHVYPQLADVPVELAWSGRMGFTRHKMPLIRELLPGLWAATGFGGHGLNTTTMAGELVATALVEGDRRYRLFEPFGPRWVGGPLGQLAAQALYWLESAKDEARTAWHRHRPQKKGRVELPPGRSRNQGG